MGKYVAPTELVILRVGDSTNISRLRRWCVLEQSQRDCINQPRVGSSRRSPAKAEARLPWVTKNKFNNPEGVGSMVANVRHWMNALQPLQG